jgi:hypothetical protein
MKKTFNIIIIVALLIFLTSCSKIEDSSNQKELDVLRLENEILKNELEEVEKEKSELVDCDVQLSILSNELEKLNHERDYIEEYFDNSREIEIIDSSLYRLRSDYFEGSSTSFIQETISGTNKGDFFLEKKNIYSFKVSNDNELIAVLFFDKKSISEQYVILYNHEGDELYTYEINDFWSKMDNSKYHSSDVIKISGFSSGNEYLWGGISG